LNPIDCTALLKLYLMSREDYRFRSFRRASKDFGIRCCWHRRGCRTQRHQLQKGGQNVNSFDKSTLTRSITWATRETEDTSGLQELALVGTAPYLTAKLPSNISFDEAATLPTALNASSVALNHADGHGIPSPFQGNRDFGKGKAALVLGGPSVVGLGGNISALTLY
jgi:hypothetical protein